MVVQDRSATVDLATDTSLMVDISDALSEQDKVKFTVHTKVSVLSRKKDILLGVASLTQLVSHS